MAFVYKPLPAYSFSDEDCKNCNNGWFDRFYMSCVNYAQDLEKIYKLTYSPIEEEKTMKKEFTKSDLKNLMVVEYRCGKRRLVVDDSLIGPHSSGLLSDYNMDLLSRKTHSLDIVKVYCRICTLDQLDVMEIPLWERKEPKEVTLKEIAEKFGVDEVKIIDG